MSGELNRGAVTYSVEGALVDVAEPGCAGMLVSSVKLVVAGAVGAGSGVVTGRAVPGAIGASPGALPGSVAGWLASAFSNSVTERL